MKKKTHLDKTVQEELQNFGQILQQNNIVFEKIILYGSFAKNQQKNYSDIDVVVISPQFGKNEIKEMMLLAKLAWQVSDRIEPIPLTEKHLQMKYHPLIGEINKYGYIVIQN